MATTATLSAPTISGLASGARRATDETQIVVFELGDERYGLDIATAYE